jgi:hypothetical protein
VKLFLFLFEPVNLHSNSWILHLKKSEWLEGQKVFREDWWRQRVFPHYQSLIIVTTIDLSIVNNASQTGRRSPFFIGQRKSGTPCMAWTNFINRKLSFPDQSSIAKWLIKEKKDNFETLSVPLLDIRFESDFKVPNLPLSLRLKVSGCHYDSIYNNTWTKQVKQLSKQHQTQWSKCQRHFYVTHWYKNIFDIFVDYLIFIHFHYMKIHRL